MFSESCLSEDIEYAPAYGLTSFRIGVGLGTNPGDRPVIDLNGPEFEVDQVREIGKRLIQLADSLA